MTDQFATATSEDKNPLPFPPDTPQYPRVDAAIERFLAAEAEMKAAEAAIRTIEQELGVSLAENIWISRIADEVWNEGEALDAES